MLCLRVVFLQFKVRFPLLNDKYMIPTDIDRYLHDMLVQDSQLLSFVSRA